VLTVFTGQNTSLLIHTTVVVTQGDTVLDFTLVTLDTTRDWVVDILNIDKGNGEIRLTDKWNEVIWKKNHRLKNKGKNNLFKICFILLSK
jgi:hypothetical protein